MYGDEKGARKSLCVMERRGEGAGRGEELVM